MIKKKNRKYLWDAAKAILRWKCIAIQSKKQEQSQINNLTLHLNKEEQNPESQ